MGTVWTTWFLILLSSFAAFESYALAKNKTTLSRFVWNLNKAWPPFGWLAGGATGFLGAHFFWICQGCPL